MKPYTASLSMALSSPGTDPGGASPLDPARVPVVAAPASTLPPAMIG